MNKSQLTLNEKLKLLCGKNNWQTEDLDGKIAPVFMNDGPCGLRKVHETVQGKTDYTIKSTAYPAGSLVACSWNRETAKLVAEGIADDCIENEVDVLLGPGVNIKRNPLCGRYFEYYSEDPFLAGELAYQFINGLQGKGVGTSLKHFALNSNENFRHSQNIEVDDRVLFEIYLEAFRLALKAKPWTVMCSYNLVNGIHSSENKRLLKEILRDKFGYDGTIISDWGAVKDSAKSLKATVDIEMPYKDTALQQLQAGLNDGFITEADVDRAVESVFSLIEKRKNAEKLRKTEYSKEKRHELAVKLAKDSVVVLKNENNILPFDKNASVTVVQNDVSGITGGGGCALVETEYPYPLLDKALREKGFNASPKFCYEGEDQSDYLIICAGTGAGVETEGHDRSDIKLSSFHEQNILNAAETNKVIVILYAGGVIDVSNFKDKVAAIIYAGFGGEGINEALADILAGNVSPCGKLAETFPCTLEDCPVDKFKEYKAYIPYKERFDVGYRYYDKHPEKITYPFGFGLSYAKFEYSDLTVKKESETDYEISYKIKNTSSVPAKEISQLYIQDVYSTCERPIKELKGFSKDEIQPNETVTVKIHLDKHSFAIYNAALGDYYVENGKYRILIGSSSQDIRLSADIKIELPYYTQFTVKNPF